MLFKLWSLSIQEILVEFLNNRIKVFAYAGLTQSPCAWALRSSLWSHDHIVFFPYLVPGWQYCLYKPASWYFVLILSLVSGARIIYDFPVRHCGCVKFPIVYKWSGDTGHPTIFKKVTFKGERNLIKIDKFPVVFKKNEKEADILKC